MRIGAADTRTRKGSYCRRSLRPRP
jgi:hypothetical protein